MEQKYKVLISIFIITILALTLVSILETDNKVNNVQENVANGKHIPMSISSYSIINVWTTSAGILQQKATRG